MRVDARTQGAPRCAALRAAPRCGHCLRLRRRVSTNPVHSHAQNPQPPTHHPRKRCGHCKALQPEWERAAAALKGVVNVAAVDADAHGALAQQYGIR